MPKEKLSAKAVENLKKIPGVHNDGGGLYLRVGAGRCNWLFRYKIGKKTSWLGLGNADDVTLADARRKATALRLELGSKGNRIDILAKRRREQAQATNARAAAVTFETVARDYLQAHGAEWRNPKHRQQWQNTITQYAYPHLADLPVAEITTSHVLAALQPIWQTKTETATRLRQRIEKIFDYAKVAHGLAGDNPARWRANLDQLLAKPAKIKKSDHFAALAYVEIGGFIAALREREGTAARVMEFIILTAARTGEAIGATWREIDMAGRVWVIPADRMKAGKEHRVPLTPRAMEILSEMEKRRPDEDPSGEAYIFPGERAGRPVSNMSMAMLLRRMGRDDITVHGFRSTFRDWAAEQTNFAREVAEQSLAHKLKDKVEAAYQRGDMLERRRQLLEAWEAYLTQAAVNAKNA